MTSTASFHLTSAVVSHIKTMVFLFALSWVCAANAELRGLDDARFINSPAYKNGAGEMVKLSVMGVATDTTGAIYLRTQSTKTEDGTTPANRGFIVLVFKSTDGGANWQRTPLPNDNLTDMPDNERVYLNPQFIFVGERDAVFACQGVLTRSRDGGQTWKKVFGQPQEQCKYLVQQANGTLWLATQGQRGVRLYKSKDDGDNWTFFTDWSESEQGWQFGVDKAETVYVSGSEILRISNGGKKKEKFPRMNPFEKYDVYVSAGDQIFLQGYHAIFIGAPPLANINRIHYASDKYLFKSVIDRRGNYFVNYGDGIMTVPANEKRMIVDGTQNCIDERRSKPITCNISQGFQFDAMSLDPQGNFYVAASSGLMRQKLN